MSDSLSKQRATMPTGTNRVLDARSLEKSNANLLAVLQPGQYVLDVGCGAGAITRGICDCVGSQGSVVGIDRSNELIDQAKERFSDAKNLSFYCADILEFNTTLCFDVITTARTLQWVAHPNQLILKMKGLLNAGGVLCVLDYDHRAIQWSPAPPASMMQFYDAFMRWRADAGMDNSIGEHVAGMMKEHGLELLLEQDQSEYSEKGAPGFDTFLNIWAVVADTRGKQMADDHYITEEERLLALKEYEQWCQAEAENMRLVLKATHARKPR